MINWSSLDKQEILERLAKLSPQKRELLLKLLQKEGITPLDLPISAVSRESNSFPLSFAQERLWFVSQLSGSKNVYGEYGGLRINRDLNVAVLQQVIATIVQHHEILRTTFKSVNGTLVQVIDAESNCELVFLDWQHLSEFNQETQVQQLAQQQAQTPFDLAQGPLLRTTLVKLKPQAYVFFIAMHHIITDGWSKGIFFQELSSLYQSYSQGQPSSLPPLPIQYADFAVWQRQWLKNVFASQLEYWKQQLAGATTLLQLPTDRPRPSVQTYQGRSQTFTINQTLTQQLQLLSQSTDTTLFMTLLAAFATLLYRYSGQEDLLIGSPIANRKRPEIESLIGFFVNTLVLRVNMAGNPRFAELLHQVQQMTLAAYAHQDTPFEQIVEALQPERSPSYSPLFQVMFVLQNAPIEPLRLAGEDLKPLKLEKVAVKFDLFLSMEKAETGLQGTWEYSTDLFDHSTIERMTLHFVTLLEGIVVNPNQPLAQLPLLTEIDRQQLLVEWNETQSDYPHDKCIHQLFEEQVERTPDAVAVVFENVETRHITSLTYQELNCRANQLAYYLKSQGVGADVLVGFCVERSIEMVVGLLGVLKAGGAYLPFDPQYPTERLSFMLEDASVQVLLTQEKLVDRLPEHSARLVYLDTDTHKFAQNSETAIACEAKPSNLAYVMYTSGSTGRPKAVAIEHHSPVALVSWAKQVFTQEQLAGVLASTSICFDLSVFELFVTLSVGGKVILAENALHLSTISIANQVTLINTVPSAIAELIRQKNLPQKVSTVNLAGEALQNQLVQQIYQQSTIKRVFNLYGPSEDTTYSTYSLIERGASGLPPIGRPISNTQIYILDQYLQPVPVGVPGELYITGAGLARGYLNRPELTDEKFIPNPFDKSKVKSQKSKLYKTGDLARYLWNGNIEYLGRIDNQVKIRGFRIELGEIEAVVTSHPKVHEAVAIARKDSHADWKIFVYAVPTLEKTVSHQISPEQPSNEVVPQWQEIFDRTYSVPTAAVEERFNTTGWKDSYTNLPITAEEMRQWLDSTVERILAHKPQRVLEIGCGTGMLLFAIAPHCTYYYGTDISQEAIDYVADNVERLNFSHTEIHLTHKSADDFEGFESQTFDTVILNSVIQYFPHVDYLVDVLSKAVASVVSGGCIFIGDVRNLSLLELFYTSVRTYQASDSKSVGQLRQQIQKDISNEKELVIDPAFFIALKQLLPRISYVKVQIKRGTYHNELTRFRYDVTLAIEATQSSPALEIEWLDWQAQSLTLASVYQKLVETQPDILGVKKVPNGRIAQTIQAREWLQAAAPTSTFRDFADFSEKLDNPGIDPEAFWDFSDDLPYVVDIRWSFESDRCYDVIFIQRELSLQQQNLTAIAPSSLTTPISDSWSQYANNPSFGNLAQKLSPKLQEFLKHKLPDYMMPHACIILEALPLTPNGKVDRQALPHPEIFQRSTGISIVPPRTPTEEILQGLWKEILGVESVGIHDNFFELGGHSLLATQLISRIRTTFSVEMALQSLFTAPTIAQFSHLVEQARCQAIVSTIPPIKSVNRDSDLPLSFAQQRLWLLEQLETASGTYNIPLAIQFTGELDILILTQSLQEIVQRHEILRTNFQAVNGVPTQVIHPNIKISLLIIDLQALPEANQVLQVQHLANQEAQHRFNLETDSLLRFSLLKLAPQSHVLLVTMHHIISDGWSISIFNQEFSALYQAFLANEPSPLPKLPIQYADYTVWQRQWLKGELLSTQLEYWKNHMAQTQPLLELPTDRPRQAVLSFRGAVEKMYISKELTLQLKQMSQQFGTTLFMTLYTAFAVLISRLAGRQDIPIGTPIANRIFPELEQLIGFFVNTLVLRLDWQDDPQFKELLLRTRKICLDAYAHQDLPFEQLVDTLRPERNLSHTPLFQVMFALQNNSIGQLELPELNVTLLEAEQVTAKFDLAVSMSETSQGLVGNWEYNTDLFVRRTILRIIGHWQTLLEAIVANPSQQVSQLSLLSEAQRYQALFAGNNTATDYPKDKCIHELFEQQVDLTPDAIAVVFGEQQLSYAKLNQRANQLAHYLQSLGVRANIPVAICLEQSIDAIVGLLAILKAGGAYLPLNAGYPPERLGFMLEDAQVNVLLTSENLLACLPEHCAKIVCLDRDWQTISLASQSNLKTETTPDNLIYIIYTSGSTGQPKGVAIPHRGVCRLICNSNYLQWCPSDRIAQVSNLAFDAATFELWGPLVHGATLVLGWSAEILLCPQTFSSLLQQHQITILSLTTAVFNQVAREVPAAFKALRYLLVGSETVNPEWIATVLQQGAPEHFLHMYGPTESTTFACWYEVKEIPTANTVIPIGKPISNTQVYILDSHRQPVPIGISGELYIGGDGLAQGYLNHPQLTQTRFIANPFRDDPQARLYQTGDLARYKSDGNIEYLGRIDHQVKIRGFRIELGEIAAQLHQHPQVEAAVVLAQESQIQDKQLVAYIVLQPKANLTVSQLRSFLLSKLPDYMLPSAFVMLESLPLNANGKIDRQALPVADLTQRQLDVSFVAPRTPTEEILAILWAEILGLQAVGIEDNFFDLGGNSLLAVVLMKQVEQRFVKRLSVKILFSNPTIAKLATVLHGSSDSWSWSPLVGIQPDGDKTPLFFVHPVSGTVFDSYKALAKHLGNSRPFYGFQAQGLEPNQEPIERIEDMASEYIKALQQIQPQGPYLLGGWSFGGLVAFEMAQQLQSQGQEVGLLGIVDAMTSFQDSQTDAEAFLRLATERLSLPFPDLANSQQIEEQFNFILEYGQQNMHVPKGFELEQFMRMYQTFRVHRQAQQIYQCRNYSAPITVFYCYENLQAASGDRTLGWGNLSDQVDTYQVTGNHHTMVLEPHVEMLAKQLNACISVIEERNINLENS